MVKKHFTRLLVPPDGSFFLFGPRGTGKSTWLRSTFPRSHYIDLLSEARFQAYLGDPGLFAAEMLAIDPGGTVVIDEVQRLPSLLNEVHRFIEERGIRFVLCGSSARKLRAGGTNLLAGRAVTRRMHPFVPAEIGEAFDLDDALRFGTLPVVISSADRKESLLAYVQTYLAEEIRAEALVRSLPGFARFLPVAAIFHSEVLNVSGLARDAGVSRTTLSGYLEILEDTLIAFRLPAHAARLRVRERRHPKLYFVDAGIVRALKRRFDPPAPEEAGHMFEGFVAGVLRAHGDLRGLFDEWWYWASGTSRRTEVDFLLRRGDAFVAIEVKSSTARPRDADLLGLRAISALDGVSRRILVYRGGLRLASPDGVEILPVGDFLDMVDAGAMW